MAKVSEAALEQVRAAFKVYIVELQTSGLSSNTVEVYKGDVGLFIRWLAGEYMPRQDAPATD